MKKNRICLDILYGFLFLFITVLLFNRCKYGIANVDESFNLTIPYRMVQGDALFLHDWSHTQLCALPLYPIMKIVLLFTKSTDGIFLIFRYIYTVVQVIASLLLYFCYKKYSKIGAMIGSILFLIYVPYNIISLTYNSMGVIALALALSIYVASNNVLLDIITGIFFAFSVLCCPFLVFLYLFYFVLFILNIKNQKNELLTTKKFLFTTLGIFIIFLIFMIYILRNMSLNQFIELVPYTLTSHSTHNINFLTKISQLINVLFNLPLIIYIQLFIFVVITIVGRMSKQLQIKCICFLIVIVNSIFSVFTVAIVYDSISHSMLTHMFTTLSIYLIFKNESVKSLFNFVFIPTVIYSFCMFMCSDQLLYALAFPLGVSIISNFVIIIVIFKENLISSHIVRKIGIFLLTIFVVSQFFVELNYRLTHVFWEKGISNQTILIENGINKGLFVSEESKNEWDEVEDDVISYVDKKKVAFISLKPWLYFMNEYENCSYSAWYSNATALYNYYKINENKLPDLIYVEAENIKDIMYLLDTFDYKFKLFTKNGNYLYEK